MSSENVATVPGVGDYLRVVRRHWVAVVVCLALGIGAAIGYLYWAPKEYQATTAVLVDPIVDPTQDASAKTAQVNMDTESQLVTSTATTAAAAAALHFPASSISSLPDNVSVSVPPNSTILDITYTGSSPAMAVRGSQAFAQAYLDQRQKAAAAQLAAEDKALQTRIDAVTNQLSRVIAADAGLSANSPQRLGNDAQATALNNQLSSLTAEQNQVRSAVVFGGQVVDQAAPPTSPSSPIALIALPAGVILGLLVGLAVAALRNRSDDRIRSAQDLAPTGLPVATVLPTRLHAGQVTVLPTSAGPDGRAYTRLRNLVTASLAGAERPVVVVAGVHHGGGPVATNLAASLARSGAEVVLVCADVFGSTSTSLLGFPQPVGLAEVLAGQTDLAHALHRLPGVPTLRVLGAGRDPDQADELLQTRNARTLVDQLLTTAAYVVIDAPAISESADAQTLAKVAEVSLVVVETGRTHRAEVADAGAQLQAMGTAVLGAVVARYGRDTAGTTPVDTGTSGRHARGTVATDTVDAWEAELASADHAERLAGRSGASRVLTDSAQGAGGTDGAELLPPAHPGPASR